MPSHCPRCGTHEKNEINELSRLNPASEHRIFRCRHCGHLWSPVEVAASPLATVAIGA